MTVLCLKLNLKGNPIKFSHSSVYSPWEIRMQSLLWFSKEYLSEVKTKCLVFPKGRPCCRKCLKHKLHNIIHFFGALPTLGAKNTVAICCDQISHLIPSVQKRSYITVVFHHISNQLSKPNIFWKSTQKPLFCSWTLLSFIAGLSVLTFVFPSLCFFGCADLISPHTLLKFHLVLSSLLLWRSTPQ